MQPEEIVRTQAPAFTEAFIRLRDIYQNYVEQLERYYKVLLEEQKSGLRGFYTQPCDGCELVNHVDDMRSCGCGGLFCVRCALDVETWKSAKSSKNWLVCEVCKEEIGVKGARPWPCKPTPPF